MCHRLLSSPQVLFDLECRAFRDFEAVLFGIEQRRPRRERAFEFAQQPLEDDPILVRDLGRVQLAVHLEQALREPRSSLFGKRMHAKHAPETR